MSLVPIPNTDEALRFLLAAFPEGPVHLVSLADGAAPEAASFEVKEEEAIRRWVNERQAKRNIYFHVNRLNPSIRNRKAAKQDIHEALWLHVDIDDLNALGVVREFSPPPTVVLYSGGGYQAFWRLDTPSGDLEGVEARNRWLAEVLGGDNCHNIDRIMRLPGTINMLSARKRALGRQPALAAIVEDLTDWTRSYPLSAFLRSTSDAVVWLEGDSFGNIPSHVELAALPSQVSEFTRGLVLHGDDLSAPMWSGRARYPSRSEAVFKAVCDLLRAGCSPEIVVSIILDPAYGISASVLQKSAPERYARRQIQSARETIATGWPDAGKGDTPRPTYRNAVIGLRRMGIVGEYDQFHQRKVIGGYQLQQFQGDLSDDGIAILRAAFIEHHGFDPGKINLIEATNYLCLENSYHPIRDYLNGLRWDGVPRLANWLETYLSADQTPLTSRIGTIVLVAAVRRIRSPGSKFDSILVLEGKQGTGKSTAIRILAGDSNFSDQDILTLDAKQQMEAMEGIWIYEISELAGLNRGETNRVKAFASRQVDQGRPAYARFRESRPRQTIFIGTTNEDTYLRDMTGNRRFWPVPTGRIAIDELRRDRDQLWAEAAVLEELGYSLTLPEDLWPAAEAEQQARLEEHPWFETLSAASGAVSMGKERITTDEIFTVYLKIDLEHRVQYQLKQVASMMRQLGWSGPKRLRLGDKTPRGYDRDTQEADRPPRRTPPHY